MKFVLSIIAIAFSLALQASSISSEEIGNFFTLPSWMQQAAANGVSSFNTPGSDPQAGGGWYIDEYTNAIVRTERWKITANGTHIEGDSLISYHGGGIYDIEEAEADIFNALAPSSYEYVGSDPSTVDGNESDDELSFSFYSVYRTDGEEYGTMAFSATATRVITKQLVPTGRKVPRSPRLFPEVMAGVNSTFEGFFERQYYAMEAQSNVWDIAAYGPRQGRHLFWFDPSDRTGGGSSSYDWDYSTNRTITTRRLFGWERVDSLADFILNPMYYRGMQLTGSERPNWIESLDTDQSDSRCYWSTTDAKVFQGTQLIPDLDGTQDPFSSSVDWSRCSQCFPCLDRDQVWDNSGNADHFGYVTNNFPTCKLMERLDFRSGDSEAYWSLRNCAPDIINGVTMGHLIETNFPNADGWAITNRTRRLFSDRLCCMNQLLSLMDRTYHVPRIDYPTTGISYTFKNSSSASGSATANIHYDEETDHVSVIANPVSWSGTESSLLTTSAVDVVSDGNAYHFRIGGISTDATVVIDDPEEQSLTFGAVTTHLIEEIVTKWGRVGTLDTNVSISVCSSFSPLRYECFIDGYDGFGRYVTLYHGYIGAGKDIPSNIVCNVDLEYVKQYDYARTTGKISLGPTQPGWESAGRVVRNKYGLILGRHLRTDSIFTSLGRLPWSQYNSFSDYYSFAGEYYTRLNLTDLFPDRIMGCYDYVVNACGTNPEDPDHPELTIGSDFGNIKNSIRIINASASIGGSNCYHSFADVSIDSNGNITINNAESLCDTESGWRYLPGFIDLFKISFTYEESHDQPSEQGNGPASLDARFGLITQTDWKWKALKRGND